MISYELPVPGLVKLAVYDLLGREVAALVNTEMPAGSHLVTWDASRFSSGVYFYTLKTNLFSSTKRMLLIR
jgi:hypothetical protein